MAKLNFENMSIAEGVVETIITMAVQDVEGVASLSGSTGGSLLASLGKKSAGKAIEVTANEDKTVSVVARIVANYGAVLPDVAQKIREAVADAAMTQIGITVSKVDVFIDGVQFA